MKFYKTFSLCILLHTNLFANIPVIDFTSITQQITSYIQQIQDFMMYEKELAKMGVDFNTISSFISSMQDQWNKINDLHNTIQGMNSNALEKMQTETRQTCDEFKNESTYFNEAFRKETENLQKTFTSKGQTLSTKELETQACINLLSNDTIINDSNKNDLIEAQNALQNNDYETFKQKTNQVSERKKKFHNQNIQNQANQINRVINSYNQYVKKNEGLQTHHQNIKKELDERIKEVASKDENQKAQASLDLQKHIIDLLIDQYEVMQTTSNMLAVILQNSLPNEAMTQEEIKKQNENLKELDEDIFRNPQTNYKKDAFGLPNFNNE